MFTEMLCKNFSKKSPRESLVRYLISIVLFFVATIKVIVVVGPLFSPVGHEKGVAPEAAEALQQVPGL